MSQPTLPNLTGGRNAFGVQLSHGIGAPMFEQAGPQPRVHRAPSRQFGKIYDGDKIRYGLLVNVSTDGCLLKTEANFVIGSHISITISHDALPNGVTTIDGTVIRRTTIDDRTAYGISFSPEGNNKQAASELYACLS